MNAILFFLTVCAGIVLVGWIVGRITGSRAWYLESWAYEAGETIPWREGGADVVMVPRFGQAVSMRPIRLHRWPVVATNRRVLLANKTFFRGPCHSFGLFPSCPPVTFPVVVSPRVPMRRFLPSLALSLLLALAACGGGAPRHSASMAAPIDCVPFARALSGVNLRGDAADWWWAAEGQYDRDTTPRVGSVLVIDRTARSRHGHLSVVSRVLSRHEILVTHANWVRHQVGTDQLVRDVSPEGDWSRIRVWWPPSDTLGNTEYPVLGFIHSGRSMTPDRLAHAVPGALRLALDEQGGE